MFFCSLRNTWHFTYSPFSQFSKLVTQLTTKFQFHAVLIIFVLITFLMNKSYTNKFSFEKKWTSVHKHVSFMASHEEYYVSSFFQILIGVVLRILILVLRSEVIGNISTVSIKHRRESRSTRKGVKASLSGGGCIFKTQPFFARANEYVMALIKDVYGHLRPQVLPGK